MCTMNDSRIHSFESRRGYGRKIDKRGWLTVCPNGMITYLLTPLPVGLALDLDLDLDWNLFQAAYIALPTVPVAS